MAGLFNSIHVNNVLVLVVFLVVWLVLCECAHIFVLLLRREPLLGWAVGPFGVTLMVLHEPSLLYLWLDVLCPALVSGSVLSVGLFTSFSPIAIENHPFIKVIILACGLLVTSSSSLITALRDLHYPLWGEARVLRTIQFLRSTWARIHFTSFGHSYVRSHFGSNPTELLQALSL
ncbi:MAG: hypothetical protein NVS2B12_10300 [Ktedonobacteraceae bacterium]